MYISIVGKHIKKSVILTDNTFHTPPLTRLYRWVILASFLCFLFAVLRSTLRIFDFVPRVGFPLFPIPLQLGIRVRYRFYELLLAIINPLGRFIEFKLVRCYRSLSTLPLDNLIAFVFYSAHSIVPCDFLDIRRYYHVWTSMWKALHFSSHLCPRCAIPCQRERVVPTGFEPVIPTLKG